MEKRTSILALAVLALALVTTLGACDGSPSSPRARYNPTPTPVSLCPLQIFPSPVAGFAGLYSLSVEPAGAYALTVNGVSRAVEAGTFVTAQSGQLVQACRPCGCSPAVEVR